MDLTRNESSALNQVQLLFLATGGCNERFFARRSSYNLYYVNLS
jgi:hypothetical protein